MANTSTTGFGLRPIKNVGQTDDNSGLSEWSIASASALISHNDLCKITGDGVILVSAVYLSTSDFSLNNLPNDLKIDSKKSKKFLKWFSKWDLNKSLNNVIEWNDLFRKNKNAKKICEDQITNYLK